MQETALGQDFAQFRQANHIVKERLINGFGCAEMSA
jgi:hypothetical protein